MRRITKKRSLSSILHPRALSHYVRRHSAATHPTCLSQSIHPSSLEIRHDVLTNRQHITIAASSRSQHPQFLDGAALGLSRKKGTPPKSKHPKRPSRPPGVLNPTGEAPPQQARPRVTRRRRFAPPTASPYGLANARLPHQEQQISTFSQNRSMQK